VGTNVGERKQKVGDGRGNWFNQGTKEKEDGKTSVIKKASEERRGVG